MESLHSSPEERHFLRFLKWQHESGREEGEEKERKTQREKKVRRGTGVRWLTRVRIF